MKIKIIPCPYIIIKKYKKYDLVVYKKDLCNGYYIPKKVKK